MWGRGRNACSIQRVVEEKTVGDLLQGNKEEKVNGRQRKTSKEMKGTGVKISETNRRELYI